jgi:hypothetical protein
VLLIRRKIIAGVVVLFFLSQKAFSCAFHEFPPFGADWYHQSIYQILFNRNLEANFGLVYNVQNYQRNFLVTPDEPGEMPHNQIVRERIGKLNYFYQFRIKSKFQCLISVSRIDIESGAIADDGIVYLRSSSANQLGLTLSYVTNVFKMKKWSFTLQPSVGFNTTFYATNIFYSKIGWLKYQWNKVSPRIIAGSDNANITSGVNGVIEKKDCRIYLSASYRFFTPNRNGFNYGQEINSFLLTGYHFNLFKKSVQLEPIAGLNYERARIDSQNKTSNKDVQVFAGGESLFLCAALNVRINQVGINFIYFSSISDRYFSKFQLYNQSRVQGGLQYNF